MMIDVYKCCQTELLVVYIPLYVCGSLYKELRYNSNTFVVNKELACSIVTYLIQTDTPLTKCYYVLQQLRHENLVNLIEVFRRKKRLFLVFEFVDHTVLDDLEKFPTGMEAQLVRKYMWQVLKGIEFCHAHHVSH